MKLYQFTTYYGRCPEAPAPPNAVMSTTNASLHTTIQYTCTNRYKFTDGRKQHNITCTEENGALTWTGKDAIPECIVIMCNPLTPPAHGAWLGNHTTVGSEAMMACDPGYEVASAVLWYTCGPDGEWTDDAENVNCKAMVCSSAPHVGNASVSAASVSFPGNITYTCRSGYWFSPGVFSKSAACLENGDFEIVNGSCKDIHCPLLETRDHVVVNTTSISYRTAVTATCSTEGNKTQVLKCGAHGKWEPEFVACKRDVSLVARETVEASGAEVTGIVILAVLFLMLVAVVVLDVVTLYSQIFLLKNNLADGWTRMKELIGKKPSEVNSPSSIRIERSSRRPRRPRRVRPERPIHHDRHLRPSYYGQHAA